MPSGGRVRFVGGTSESTSVSCKAGESNVTQIAPSSALHHAVNLKCDADEGCASLVLTNQPDNVGLHGGMVVRCATGGADDPSTKDKLEGGTAVQYEPLVGEAIEVGDGINSRQHYGRSGDGGLLFSTL